jgi:hypothetical protein
MKFTRRYGIFLIAMAVVASGAAILTPRVAGQDDAWQIVRADYGSRNQRNDVTDILKDLIGRGGVNGRVAVNNQTMGGDPAVGADKSLRIFARNRRNEEREFNFKEGGFIEARMFAVRRDDVSDRPTSAGDRDRDRDHDRDDGNNLRIIGAYYGIQGRTVNVTEVLRGRVREGTLSFMVTNGALGGDPAIGADKILIVVYRYQGSETATAVREGSTLTIP